MAFQSVMKVREENKAEKGIESVVKGLREAILNREVKKCLRWHNSRV